MHLPVLVVTSDKREVFNSSCANPCEHVLAIGPRSHPSILKSFCTNFLVQLISDHIYTYLFYYFRFTVLGSNLASLVIIEVHFLPSLASKLINV